MRRLCFMKETSTYNRAREIVLALGYTPAERVRSANARNPGGKVCTQRITAVPYGFAPIDLQEPRKKNV